MSHSLRGTPRYRAAIHDPDQHALCHAMELQFGGRIAADPSAPGFPWTWITYEFTNSSFENVVKMYVSLDDGLTWQLIARGARIPGIAIGDSVAGLKLRLRQVFIGDASSGPVLKSIHAELHFESGDSIVWDEPGNSALSEGSFFGTEYDVARGGVVVKEEPILQFVPSTDPEGLRRAIAPKGTGPDGTEFVVFGQGVDVCNGVPLFLDGPDYPEVMMMLPDIASGNWRAKLEFMLEMWIQPDSVTPNNQTLAAWMRTPRWVGTFATPQLPCYTILRLHNDKLELNTKEEYLHAIIEEDGSVSNESKDDYDRDLASPNGLIEPGEWSHVAVRYTGSEVELWINGQVAAFASWHWNDTTAIAWLDKPDNFKQYGFVVRTDGPLLFGTARKNNDHFKGKMDEIRLWRRAVQPQQRWQRRIHPSEIAGLIASPTHQLEAYWTFSNHAPPTVPFEDGIEFDQAGQNDMRLFFRAGAVTPTTHDTWNKRSFGSTPASPTRDSPPIDLTNTGDITRLTTAPMNLTLFGETFYGVGAAATISPIQESTDLAPRGMELALNGVDPAIIVLALGVAYQDLPVKVWSVLLDKNNAVVEDPMLIFEGEMDQLLINESGGDTDEPRMAGVQVNCESHLLDWERPSGLVWNSLQQQQGGTSRDFGLEFLAEVVERQIWWPAQVPPDEEPL